MAYDEELADRIRELISEHGVVEEKRMFGGLSFLLGGHLAVAASGKGGLLVRVGADEHAALQDGERVAPMAMGGRESKTWLQVAAEAVGTKRQLRAWVERGVAAVSVLPPKA